MADESGAAPTAAERRLDEHLELLRDGEPEPDRHLARRVVRSARWQRAVREPLRVVGMIGASVLAGLGAVLGGRR